MIPTYVYLTPDEVADALHQGDKVLLRRLLDRMEEAFDGTLSAETMKRLDGSQLTLVAYRIFRREMLEGGMVQLIHNGYGPFIFENPFAKAMRLWGLHDFSNFIYSARRLYEKHHEAIVRDVDDAGFMALYEQFDDLSEIDDRFVDDEPEVTAQIAAYVSQNIDRFNRRLTTDVEP